MEPAWRQQGRGRGGGGGGRGQQQSEPSQQQPPQKSRGRGVGGGGGGVVGVGGRGGGGGGTRKDEEHAEQGVSVQSQSKFEDIRKSNQAAAQKLVQNQYSSSSDDDDDDDDDDDEEEQVDKKEGKRGKILQSTFTTYTHTTGGDISGLQRTSQFVSDLFQSGATSCLICISSIRRTQPVWSCEGCYCVFHISCIQQWARDSAFLVSSVTDEDFGQKKHPWPCPKCRTEYAPSSTPNRYMCYCGKVQDPPPDPWLLPHSCGSVCERDLQPVCGHTCLLLCHPGPCPPCPKMVTVSCLCGKAKPLPRRCSNKGWACQQKCGKLLPCKQHSCTQPCHSGVCKECPRVSVQRCVCGKEQAERECASPRWHCQQICGVSLPCGHHVCEQACHDGPCGECPRSGRRACPCGKSEYSLPCTEDVGTCGDTCGRPLACGLHRCSMRCHRGQCETCRQEVERSCRCGRCKRVTSCHKEYVCDFKCPQQRGCQRHQCRRKCCPGNCTPCDLLCGRTLGCRNHKCPSGCHPGSCYPCPETVEVRCACGQTAVTVPCGRERHTRPPRCKQLCRAPPSCHHPSREPHRCHDDACPACRQCCSKPLPKCEHTCPASCHDNVMVKTQQVQVSGPWEKPAGPSFVQKNLPCPPCVVPIATSCFGEHEVSPVPCHKRGPFSCKRPCGRPLTCGNHSCRRECHTVATGNKEQSRKQCEVCDEVCAKPRPAGCHHPCPLACHRGDCPPCPRQTRQRCHCCLSHVYVDCTKWTEADKQTRINLTSCKNQCPKELQCGHRCKEPCHPGSCEVKCQHRMKMRCPCKRIKKDYLCYQQCVVECDDDCRAQLKKASQLKEEEEKAVQEEEQKRLQAELEAFEKRQKGRRGKKRGRREEVEEAESGWWRGHGLLMLLPLAVGGAMLAAGLYYLVY